MKLLSFILASAAATACLAHQALAYSYNTAWFTQTLDHFDFSVTNTWQQRYLIQDQYWDSADPNAPILFYTGTSAYTGMLPRVSICLESTLYVKSCGAFFFGCA